MSILSSCLLSLALRKSSEPSGSPPVRRGSDRDRRPFTFFALVRLPRELLLPWRSPAPLRADCSPLIGLRVARSLLIGLRIDRSLLIGGYSSTFPVQSRAGSDAAPTRREGAPGAGSAKGFAVRVDAAKDAAKGNTDEGDAAKGDSVEGDAAEGARFLFLRLFAGFSSCFASSTGTRSASLLSGPSIMVLLPMTVLVVLFLTPPASSAAAAAATRDGRSSAP